MIQQREQKQAENYGQRMWCWVCAQDVLALGEDLQQRDDHELPQLLAPDQHHNHLNTNAPNPPRREGDESDEDVMRTWP